MGQHSGRMSLTDVLSSPLPSSAHPPLSTPFPRTFAHMVGSSLKTNRKPAQRRGQEQRVRARPAGSAEIRQRPRPAVPLVPTGAAIAHQGPTCVLVPPEQTSARADLRPRHMQPRGGGETIRGGKGLQGTAKALGADARRGGQGPEHVLPSPRAGRLVTRTLPRDRERRPGRRRPCLRGALGLFSSCSLF